MSAKVVVPGKGEFSPPGSFMRQSASYPLCRSLWLYRKYTGNVSAVCAKDISKLISHLFSSCPHNFVTGTVSQSPSKFRYRFQEQA